MVMKRQLPESHSGHSPTARTPRRQPAPRLVPGHEGGTADAIDGSRDDGFLALSQLLCRALAGLRPVCASAPFNEALVRLQEHSDAQAATLAPSPLEAALGGLGYAPGEVDGSARCSKPSTTATRPTC